MLAARAARLLLPARARALGLPARTHAPSRTMCTQPLSYSERMDKTGRPISPHVFIYRFPMIALSSITVRITGILASAGLFAVGGAVLYKGSDWVVDTVHDFGGVSQRLTGFDLQPAAKASV